MVKKGAEENKEVIGKNNSAWILKSEEKNSVFDTKNRDRMTNQNYRTNQKSLIMSSNTKRKIYSVSLLSLFSDVSLLLLKISASLFCISLIIPSVYGKKTITNIILIISYDRKSKLLQLFSYFVISKLVGRLTQLLIQLFNFKSCNIHLITQAPL